jgi:hypothetical protein
MAWSFFRLAICSLYINCMNFRKIHHFPEPTVYTSNALSILYNFGVSIVHNIRLRALNQEICTRDFRVAWSFFVSAICSYCLKSVYKHYFPDPTVKTIRPISMRIRFYTGFECLLCKKYVLEISTWRGLFLFRRFVLSVYKVYKFGVSSVHNTRLKTLTQEM